MTAPQKFTALPQAFDASGIPPAQPFEVIPNGDYNVNITDGEIKPTENGAGIRFEFELTVLDGPYVNRKVFDGLNIQHSSVKAQEISQQQLSAICHATGVIRFQDVQELFGKPFVAKIGNEPGRWVNGQNQEVPIPAGHPAGTPPPGATKWYDPKNRFKGAKAGSVIAAPATGAVAGGAPAWAALKVAANPAPSAAPQTPPWASPAAVAATPAPVAAPAGPKAPAPAAAPKGPKATKKAERTFFVFMPDGTVKQPAITESEVAKMLANGMPPETMVNPGLGDDDWKTAAEYGIGAATAAPAPAPAAATAAGAPVPPPWARS